MPKRDLNMLNEDGLIEKRKKGRSLRDMLKHIPRAERNTHMLTDNEIAALPVGTVVTFDVETYWNFFYICFKVFGENKYFDFEMSPWGELDKKKLSWVMWHFYLLSFNGNGYDIPIIELALKNFVTVDGEMRAVNNALLKKASDEIVKFDLRPFAFEKRFGLKIPKYNHVDVMPIAPLDGSLKLYGARYHAKRLQDLPFPEDHMMTEEDAGIMRPYCANDLELTEGLATELFGEIELREKMSKQYEVDLRSKSDAQIAEAVICNELKKLQGYYPQKPNVASIEYVQYEVPDFVRFETSELQKITNDIANAKFYLNKQGSPEWPEGLGLFEKKSTGSKGKWVLKAKVGNMSYTLGMGGLHSTEEKVAHVPTEDEELADNDVESFYPRIVLNQKLFPVHLGEAFLHVYETIVTTRLKAKKEKLKVVADSLKIVINGAFGKLGERFSRIYSPQLLLQVTITGQLSLLMLIEKLTLGGINVVSGNTDGIVSKYLKTDRDKVRALISEWEQQTNFKTEETLYKATYSRDVNNYIAHTYKPDPDAKFLDQRLGFKLKGCYGERGSALNSVLSKNPECLVCVDAVMRFLDSGKPLMATIKECQDIRRFVSIRNVTGGAEKDGFYLGKTVRWYYAKDTQGAINYVLSGNKVPLTDGAKPVMDLPDQLPEDIDYEYYANRAEEMLFDIGRFKRAETPSLF